MRGRPAGPPADGTYARLIRRAWLVALLARPAALALACMHCGGFGAGAQHHTGGFPLLVDSSSVPSLARQSRRSAGRRPPFALFTWTEAGGRRVQQKAREFFGAFHAPRTTPPLDLICTWSREHASLGL